MTKSRFSSILVLLSMVVLSVAGAKAAPAVSDTITLTSALLPQPMKVTVVTPTDTSSPRPTVYLLNGYGQNNHKAWSTITDLDSLADRYGVIIVCPSGYNTWYFDSPVQTEWKMESFITGELINTIDSLYPTIPSPEMRAITGFSMGGHGAMWLAIRHPELFGSVGATSGGVDFTPFPENWNLPALLGPRDENPELWKSHTVAAAVDTLTPGRLNIVFDCGTEDFFYPVNCALDSAMNALRIPHQYFIMPGAHNAPYWSRSIMRQLDFFDRIFRAGAVAVKND